MSINFATIASTLNTVSQKMESNLQSTIEEIAAKEDPSSTDLINMQQGLQQWTLAIQTQSTMIKELGDTLKGIVQKAG